MKNFNEFFSKNDIVENTKKILESEDNDLISEIKEFLLTEYPSSWWAEEFFNRVSDYMGERDLVGYGTYDDESTWDYKTVEDAYKNLSTGGAIEYDLFGEIRNDIKSKFHLTDEEYERHGIDKLVEDHMCNMCDWYDHMLFGKDKREPGDFLGIRKNFDDLMSKLKDMPSEIKTSDGKTIKI